MSAVFVAITGVLSKKIKKIELLWHNFYSILFYANFMQINKSQSDNNLIELSP